MLLLDIVPLFKVSTDSTSNDILIALIICNSVLEGKFNMNL